MQWSGSGRHDIFFDWGLALSLQHNLTCTLCVSYAPSHYGKCSNLMFDAFSSVSLSSNSLIRNGVRYPQKRRGHPFRFSDFLLPVLPSSSGKFCPVFAPQIAAGQWTPSPCACVVSGECGRVTSLMMMMQVLPPVGATPALACPLSESVHPAKVLNAIK